MNNNILNFKNNYLSFIYFYIFQIKNWCNFSKLPPKLPACLPNIMDITLTISIIMAMTLSVFVIFKFATRFLKGSSSSSNSSTKNEVNGNYSSKKSSIASSSSSGSSTSPNTILSTQRTRSGRHVVHKKFPEDEILYWYFWYLGCFLCMYKKKVYKFFTQK